MLAAVAGRGSVVMPLRTSRLDDCGFRGTAAHAQSLFVHDLLIRAAAAALAGSGCFEFRHHRAAEATNAERDGDDDFTLCAA